eukprot:1793286-Alexandrium_andersonii.AAC.1
MHLAKGHARPRHMAPDPCILGVQTKTPSRANGDGNPSPPGLACLSVFTKAANLANPVNLGTQHSHSCCLFGHLRFHPTDMVPAKPGRPASAIHQQARLAWPSI